MNDKDRATILGTLLARTPDEQRLVAEKICEHPHMPERTPEPIMVDSAAWATVYVGSKRAADLANYLGILHWFYASVAPTDALLHLIAAKHSLIRTGKDTAEFWGMLKKCANES